MLGAAAGQQPAERWCQIAMGGRAATCARSDLDHPLLSRWLCCLPAYPVCLPDPPPISCPVWVSCRPSAGVTGFGSAILVLCVWVVCTVAGVNAGSLQQAVLTECVAQAALALPLLVLTRAHATCSWGLVASLSVFGVSVSSSCCRRAPFFWKACLFPWTADLPFYQPCTNTCLRMCCAVLCCAGPGCARGRSPAHTPAAAAD